MATTTLTSGINASVTTIPVVTVAGFLADGHILIDSEIVKYTGTSGGNSFTGCIRGVAGSTAASHLISATVTESYRVSHHVVIGTTSTGGNGTGLLLAEGGYERRLGQQYAAKLSIAGTTQDDRLGTQSWQASSWSGGEGHLRHDPANPSRYRAGAGIDTFTEAGALGLGPYLSTISGGTSATLAVNEISCLHAFSGLLMIGTSTGLVYQWDGTTLTFCYDTGKAGGIRSMMTWESYLYVGTGTDGVVFRWVRATPTTTWATNFTVGARSGDTVRGVHGLSPHVTDGFYAGYYAASEDNYALVGQIANTGGTTVPTVALNTYEKSVSLIIPYREKLMAVVYNATDNFWRLFEGGNDPDPLIWTAKGTQVGGYLNCATMLNDRLYFGDAVQGRIWRYDGSKITLLRQLGSDQVPYTAQIKGIAAWRGGVWVSIVDVDGTMGLLRYDDEDDSWSRPATGLLGTTPGVMAVYNDQLHVVTNATGASRVWRTNGTYRDGGPVDSGLIDANLGGTDKLWQGVTVRHSALASNQAVSIYYQLEDTGSWVLLGHSDVDNSTSKSLDFAASIEADLIAFRMILSGTAGSSTPLRVYSLNARYVPSPGVTKEWTLRVRMLGNTGRYMPLRDGITSTQTGEQISAALWALVDAVTPVNYVDIDGTVSEVLITEWRESEASLHVGTNAQGWELDGQLTLREV